MPELPEVEVVRAGLEPWVRARRVVHARVLRADVIEGPRDQASLLVGCTLDAPARRGKQLALRTREGPVVVVHLGMTGSLTLRRRDAPPPAPHTHLVWTLRGEHGDESTLVFRDPRRFGGVWPLADPADLAQRWAALGVDALELTPDHVRDRLRASPRAIKAALLDQSLIAGVGNIYADEALFRARLRPTKRAARLTPSQLRDLCDAVRRVLREAVRAGGSSIRDYVNADGSPGGFALRHAVYGRGGEACYRCGARLRSAAVAQRTTVWCPSCQK